MSSITAMISKEWTAYFATPVAYIFIAVFLTASSGFAFYLSGFYEREQADLSAFFAWHPWLFLFFVPAISMRLWAEERRSGTFELLTVLPEPMWKLALGKFLAAWGFIGLALFFTFPVWITVSYLGDPDHGVIFSSYLGSFLLAGAYLAIGSCISAFTTAQVVAFVMSVFICFLFTISGYTMVLNFFSSWLPQSLLEVISSMSFLVHYENFTRGLIEMPALLFFAIFTTVWLFINAYVLEEI